MLLQRGQLPQAEAAFKAALERTSPCNQGPTPTSGNALMGQQRHQEAAALMQRALPIIEQNAVAIARSATARYHAVAVYLNLSKRPCKTLQRPTEAATVVRRALAIDPNNIQAQFNLIAILRSLGDNEGALAKLQQFAKAMPRPSVEVYFQLGEIATDLGQTEAAKAYFNRALAVPSHQRHRPQPPSRYPFQRQTV